MNSTLAGIRDRWLPRLTAFGDNPALAAVRAGMVAVVPLTIIGGLFMVLNHLPLPGWEQRLATLRPLLEVPVTATFGLLGGRGEPLRIDLVVPEARIVGEGEASPPRPVRIPGLAVEGCPPFDVDGYGPMA